MRAIPPASTSGTGCGCTSWCVDLDLNHFSPAQQYIYFQINEEGHTAGRLHVFPVVPYRVLTLSPEESLCQCLFPYLSICVRRYILSFIPLLATKPLLGHRKHQNAQQEEEEQEANWCTQFILLPSTEACVPRRHLMATSRKQPREDMLVFTRPDQTTPSGATAQTPHTLNVAVRRFCRCHGAEKMQIVLN